MAALIKKNNDYLCDNCYIKQPSVLEPYCIFCAQIFSNYEEVMINKFKEEQENEINGEDKLRCNLCC